MIRVSIAFLYALYLGYKSVRILLIIAFLSREILVIKIKYIFCKFLLLSNFCTKLQNGFIFLENVI